MRFRSPHPCTVARPLRAGRGLACAAGCARARGSSDQVVPACAALPCGWKAHAGACFMRHRDSHSGLA